MKISKAKLRQIIKEELSRVSEGERADRMWASNPRNPEFEGDESSLGNPKKDEIDALAYERLFNAVGDLIRTALEEDGLRPVAIQMALAEAVSEELGPVQDYE